MSGRLPSLHRTAIRQHPRRPRGFGSAVTCHRFVLGRLVARHGGTSPAAPKRRPVGARLQRVCVAALPRCDLSRPFILAAASAALGFVEFGALGRIWRDLPFRREKARQSRKAGLREGIVHSRELRFRCGLQTGEEARKWLPAICDRELPPDISAHPGRLTVASQRHL